MSREEIVQRNSKQRELDFEPTEGSEINVLPLENVINVQGMFNAWFNYISKVDLLTNILTCRRTNQILLIVEYMANELMVK